MSEDLAVAPLSPLLFLAVAPLSPLLFLAVAPLSPLLFLAVVLSRRLPPLAQAK